MMIIIIMMLSCTMVLDSNTMTSTLAGSQRALLYGSQPLDAVSSDGQHQGILPDVHALEVEVKESSGKNLKAAATSQ